jgi:energy-coupling factor transporter transmembrane protein EcfT
MEVAGIFYGILYGHLVYFVTIWSILWLFGIFVFTFWYVVPRKIWQPWLLFDCGKRRFWAKFLSISAARKKLLVLPAVNVINSTNFRRISWKPMEWSILALTISDWCQKRHLKKFGENVFRNTTLTPGGISTYDIVWMFYNLVRFWTGFFGLAVQ